MGKVVGMVAVLVVLVVAALVAAIVVFTRAIRYYASAYARATKRDWSSVARSRHDYEVYRASRMLERAATGKVPKDAGGQVPGMAGAAGAPTGKAPKGGERMRLLFDVALPCEGAVPAALDMVAITPRGVLGVMVQEGKGALAGAADAEYWLAITREGGEDSERVFPNKAVEAARALDALKGYLAPADAPAPVPVCMAFVFAPGIDMSQAEFSDEVLVVSTPGAGRLLGRLPGADARLRADALKQATRALRACSNAHAGGSDGDEAGGSALRRLLAARSEGAAAWARAAIADDRPSTAGGQLVRQADKLAAAKDDFDALTWDRILEIGDDLATERNPERIAELAAELRLIARTNVALNYRFGIAQAPEGASLTPAGLVTQTQAARTPAAPDAGLARALESAEASGFFDDDAALDDGEGEGGGAARQ